MPSKNYPQNGKQKPISIAVMGTTGSGKSTFINLVSGSTLPVSRGLRSCTQDVHWAREFFLDNRTVQLIDTPGFDDTTKSEVDILRNISAALENHYKAGARLHGVLYLHRVTDIRMGGASIRSFRLFRKMCGDDSLKNTAIITTMWDKVPPDEAIPREDELKTDPEFFEPALRQQAKLLRHDNTLESAHRIIREIFVNHPSPIDIQVELVKEQKHPADTNAGKDVKGELDRLTLNCTETIAKLQEELQSEPQGEGERELQEQLRSSEMKLERAMAEMRKLRANYFPRSRAARDQDSRKSESGGVAGVSGKGTVVLDERRLSSESLQALPMGSQNMPISIAVMGTTGSGKSTFINLVSGSDLPVSNRLAPCTQEMHWANKFTLDGHTVQLLDTPGFDDTQRGEVDTLKAISRALETHYKTNIKLHGVIYLHRVTDMSTGTRSFKLSKKICGDNFLKNTAIVTTMWDCVPPEEAAPCEDELKTDPKFFQSALRQHAKLLRHDNTLESANNIIRAILANHHVPRALAIQVELVEEQKHISDTTVGKDIEGELNRLIENINVDVNKIEEELMNELPEGEVEELRARLRASMEKLGNVMTELGKLKEGYHRRQDSPAGKKANKYSEPEEISAREVVVPSKEWKVSTTSWVTKDKKTPDPTAAVVLGGQKDPTNRYRTHKSTWAKFKSFCRQENNG